MRKRAAADKSGRIKLRWRDLHLNTILTGMVVGIFFFPVVIFMIWYFWNMRQEMIQSIRADVQVSLNRGYNQTQKLIEMCSLSTEVVLNNKELIDRLNDFYEGQTLSLEELLEFDDGSIAAIESISITNPNIYGVRLYIDSETLTENMPVLYRLDRMQRLNWGNERPQETVWYFDYADTLFEKNTGERSRHLAGMVTPVENNAQETIGYIEVAVKMGDLFPSLYEGEEVDYAWYTDKDGRVYGQEERRIQAQEQEALLEQIDFTEEECQTVPVRLESGLYMAGYIPVKELSGYYVGLFPMDDELAGISAYRNYLLVLFGVILVAASVLIRLMIRGVLRQFYLVLDHVRKVQEGDLSVQIPEGGISEMRELTVQINQMLVEINRLMKENIAREVMIKDTQLRALQNQINAHFIYNVLESIKMMAELSGEYAISDSVTVFGKLLRYGMKWGERDVTVEEEVEYCKNYLELLQMQSDYEIRLAVEMEDEVWRQKLPKMSLQPIVENAICHGLEDIAEDTVISLKGSIRGASSVIEITDMGKGMDEEELCRLRGRIAGEIEETGGAGNGIGLRNVQERIQAGFGKEYGISVQSKKDCYTKITVKIPYDGHRKRAALGEEKDEESTNRRG